MSILKLGTFPLFDSQVLYAPLTAFCETVPAAPGSSGNAQTGHPSSEKAEVVSICVYICVCVSILLAGWRATPNCSEIT